MNHDPTNDAASDWLAQARQARAAGQLQQADHLYLRHFRHARTDVPALAEFGLFCLQTGRPLGARYLLHRAHALHPGDPSVRTHLAYAHLELRQFDLALAHFRGVLAAAPDDAQANHGLGLCLLDGGDAAGAVAALERALAATPPDAALPVLVRLAEACHRAGEDARARDLFARAHSLAAEHPAVLLAHARFLRATALPAQALTLLDRCLRHDPDEPRLLLEKAHCLRLLGQTAQAAQWLDRLAQIAPALPEGAEEAGNCLLAMGKVAESRELWTRAIDAWLQAGDLGNAQAAIDRLLAIDPDNTASWNARGSLAAARQRFADAEAAWRHAIADDPRSIAAAANLAAHLENANRLPEARAVAEAALPYIQRGRQAGSAAGLLLGLARVERREHAPERALALLSRPEATEPGDMQLALAELEKGKILHALGRPHEAMAAFTAGNAAAAREWLRQHPEPNQVIAGIDQVLGLAATGWFDRLRPIPDLPTHPPLAFLLSFPRSGTTLLNQVLDGHPAIRGMDELPAIARIVESLRDIPGGYPHALAELDAIDVDWLRQAYLREVSRHVDLQPGQLLLDKFPTGTVLAGALHRIFPQARFVFALRHPCDVVLSCFMQGFALSETMFNFCTLADTVALYTRTMDLWQVLCEQLTLPVHTIRYETLVEDFDGQIAALCRFLDVPWRDDLRDYAAKARARDKIKTPSYEQVVRPIYGEARGRWQRYRQFLEPHLPTLQPYIERFGYADAPAHPTS